MGHEDEAKRIRAARFAANNGRVLRMINVLRTNYNKLSPLAGVLKADGVTDGEFLDCVNFLSEEGYIHLRSIGSRAAAELADSDWRELEAKVTGKGIRLLAGDIPDKMIEV